MKKNISFPELRVVRFESQDVIVTSSPREDIGNHNQVSDGDAMAPGRNSSLWD